MLKAIIISGLFDADWYIKQYPEAAKSSNPLLYHIQTGWKLGHNPSEYFNTNFYLQTYPDIAQAKICPLVHYVSYGKQEGRRS